MPGNWDRLNTRAIYPSSNDLGIPDMPHTSVVPGRLTAYNSRYGCENAQPGDAVHFFLDDYRFEVVWNKPEKGLLRPVKVGMSLTPDFSMWQEMPEVMQQWQVYRSRWCGLWMYHHGIDVIPTVSWSGEASYGYAFLGIAQGSTVAVSTVGVGKGSQGQFASGLEAMAGIIRPATVLVHGRPVPATEALGNAVYYPHTWRQ